MSRTESWSSYAVSARTRISGNRRGIVRGAFTPSPSGIRTSMRITSGRGGPPPGPPPPPRPEELGVGGRRPGVGGGGGGGAGPPPRRYEGQRYWARPVPGFGDPDAN